MQDINEILSFAPKPETNKNKLPAIIPPLKKEKVNTNCEGDEVMKAWVLRKDEKFKEIHREEREKAEKERIEKEEKKKEGK